MYCTVLRPFTCADGMLAAGQVVDTSTWRPRNLEVLIKRRWVREEPTYGLTHADTAEDEEPEYRAGRAKRVRE